MVPVLLLFLLLALGRFEQTQRWGASCEAIPSTTRSPVLVEAVPNEKQCTNDLCKGLDKSTLPMRPRGLPRSSSADDDAPAHKKRAGSDSDGDDVSMGDDESDEEMFDYDYDGEEFLNGEDPWYARAVKQGDDNIQLEIEARNIFRIREQELGPNKDPPINREGRIKFKVSEERFKVFEEVHLKDFLGKIDRVGFFDESSYLGVQAYNKYDKGAFVTTMISVEDGHMIISKDHSAVTDSGDSWEFLAGCWAQAKARAPDLSDASARVSFISIEKVTNPTTIKQMVIARQKWFQSGGRGTMSPIFAVIKASIPFSDENSKNVWSALRGTIEIDAAVQMLSRYPDFLGGRELSVIYLGFDKLNDPTAVDVFLEFYKPRSVTPGEDRADRMDGLEDGSDPKVAKDYLEFQAKEESEKPQLPRVLDDFFYDPAVLILDGDHKYVSGVGYTSTPALHPLLPDISRTTYQPKHQATFRTFRTRYNSGGRETNIYLISCSPQEHHLVFLRFENEDYDTPANRLQANAVIGEIFYALWVHQTGPGSKIREITFATLRPGTEDSLTRAFGGIASVNGIQTAKFTDPHFMQVARTFLQQREGKAIRTLITKYGGAMGNPYISAIEYGKYASKEGFFLYVSLGFGTQPLVGAAATWAARKQTFLSGLDEALANQRSRTLFLEDQNAQRNIHGPVVFLDPDTLLGNFEGSPYETRGSTKQLIFTSPAENHLASFVRSYPNILYARLWDHTGYERPDLAVFRNQRYPGVFIGPKGSLGGSRKYIVAAHWKNEHIVVIDIPQQEPKRSDPSLEDIIFAAWLKVLAKYSGPQPVRSRRHRNGAPIRHISFLKVLPSTHKIIKFIFNFLGATLDSPRCISDPVSNYVLGTTPISRKLVQETEDEVTKRKAKVDRELRASWLLLFGTFEVQAASAAFRKYSSQMSFTSDVEQVCMRWAGKVGEETPEILIVAAPTKPVRGTVLDNSVTSSFNQLLINPDARFQETASLGFKNLIVMRTIWSLIGENGQFITSDEYEFQETASGISCPRSASDFVKQIFSRRLREGMRFEFSTGVSYSKYTITSRTESLRYNFIVSGIDRHIVISTPLPRAGLDREQLGVRLAQVLAKTWNAYAKTVDRNPKISLATIRRNEGESSLRIVTFLSLYEETGAEVLQIWASFFPPGTAPEHVDIVISSGRLSLNGARSQLTALEHAQYIRFLGLDEVNAVAKALQDYPHTTISRTIVSIAVQGDPGNLKLLVYMNIRRHE
ncbi:hypothetical protein TWF281_004808 [Arthrobotrys megalospora]